MRHSRLWVLSSLSAFPQVTKNSTELERVGSRESTFWCHVITNMVGCEKVDFSDNSSLSSVSSEELDIMGSDREEGVRGKDVSKRKGKVNDSFLACHEDKFPSDSEEENRVRDVGRGRGRRVERGMGVDVSVIVQGSRRGRPSSLSNMGVPGWFGVGGGQRGTPSDPTAQYNPRFGKPTLFSVPRRGDSPPVPLGGFKSTTMSRVNPGCLIEGSSGGFEPRKRKPRLDASLKICSNFVNDVLSKKHKGWVWPLYKPDRGKDSVFREPIYLVDIKTKLADRKYSRPEEFAADMRKLIGNYCRYYNVNHQYHHSAKQLQELFEQEFKKVQEVGGGGDGNKWVVGGGGAEVRGKRFKECVVGGSPQMSCTPVPSSTPLVVSAAGVEGGVGKKGVAMAVSKLKGASLSVWVPTDEGSDGKGCQVSPIPVVSRASESFDDESEREGGRGAEARKDGAGCSEVVADSLMNATLSVLKVEANEEGEGSSGVGPSDSKDDRVVGTLKRGADALEGGDEATGGKRMKVGEGSGDMNVRVGENSVANAPTIADVKIKPVCKWILDGFNSVPANEQESVLREIRGAVGMEQLDMEGVVLGTLSGEDLRVVANVIVGVLTGVRVEKDKCDEKEVGFKVANEVITSSQSNWHKMQQDLSSIRESTYATLIKINHMQEFSFETLNDLHSRKNDLTK